MVRHVSLCKLMFNSSHVSQSQLLVNIVTMNGTSVRRLLLCLVLLGLVCAPNLACGSDKKSFHWDFNEDEVKDLKDDFYFDETGETPEAKWRIFQEDDNHYLGQVATLRSRTPYALAVVDDLRIKHVALQARIKASPSDDKPKAGIVWRYRNSENYLVACIDFDDRRVRLYRVVGGNRVMFGRGEKLHIETDKWYTLRVEHRDDRIKVYLDDEAFIIEKDKHYRKHGKVGLWTQTESATYFDDFRVRFLHGRD